MKFRKILSATLALAMSVSAFAGLATTASADTNYKYTSVYESTATTSAKNSSSDLTIENYDTEDAVGMKITYTVTTNVDYSNTNGNRWGSVTLYGQDSSGGDITILSISANTAKTSGSGIQVPYRRYRIGAAITTVDSEGEASSEGIGTAFDSSTDNSTDHSYDVTLESLNGEFISGSIVSDDVSYSFNDSDISELNNLGVDTFKSFTVYSSGDGNTMQLSDVVIHKVTESTEAAYLNKIDISTDDDTTVKYTEGTTISLTAKGYDQYDAEYTIEPTWTSSDESIATVDDGVVTLVGDPTEDTVVTITATSGTVSGIISITVRPSATLATITAVGSTYVEYESGKQIQMSADTVDQYGDAISADVTWTSSDTDVATIDSSTGVASLLKAGSVTFKASSGSVESNTVTTTVVETFTSDDEYTLASEDYSSITSGTSLAYETTEDSKGVVNSTSKNAITYSLTGARSNGGGNTTKMTVGSDGQLSVFLGNYASANRVPFITFDNAVDLGSEVQSETLEFDLTFASGAYEKVRIYDGTSTGYSGTATTVTNTIATIENTSSGVELNGTSTGLSGTNKLHIRLVLTNTTAYTEVTDLTTGITYASSDSNSTTKIAGIVFGNNTTTGMYMYVDNINLYVDASPVITSATANTADKLDLSDTTLVPIDDSVGVTPETGDTVTTYTIAVKYFAPTVGQVPTLKFSAESGQDDLTPSSKDIVYGYDSGIYHYFIIQTLNIDATATTVTVEGVDSEGYPIN